MRRALAALVVATVSLAVAAPALAHVTVQPGEGASGDFGTFSFSVPNESDSASTVKLEVQFPAGLFFVSFEPVPGWTHTETTETVPEAERPTAEPGEEAPSTRVATVTFTGGKVLPGEFLRFPFSAKLPDTPGELMFKAVQTYDDGTVVRWIADAETDAHPAPRLAVAAGEVTPTATVTPKTTSSSSSSSTGALVLAIVALVVVVAALGLALARRRTPRQAGSG